MTAINAPYKLCILAAGVGSRNTVYKNLHKALLPLGNQAVISRIINLVPHEIPIIVAVGYKSEQIISYLAYVHPYRKITFVHVDNFDGSGSGPGLSLYRCSSMLQCPFIFLGADTLIDSKENNFTPFTDWVGVGSCSSWCDNTDTYCLYDEEEGFYYGNQKGGWEEWDNCFIGIAGIKNYRKFWKNLEDSTLIKGEHQVLNGFSDLNCQKLKFKSWRDTGNNMSYSYARREYPVIVEPKPDEAIFIDGGKVLKYFDDADKVKSRVDRSHILQPDVPVVIELNENIYGYDYIKGYRFSDIKDEKLFKEFFNFVKSIYLSDRELIKYSRKDFQENCEMMYKKKTYSRVESHLELEKLEKIKFINGNKVPSVFTLLDNAPWENTLAKAIPAILHADMSPENIIYDIENKKFKLIDWRDKFGNDLYVGDVYYDLSKLDHALLVNGEVVRAGLYDVKIDDDKAEIEIHQRSNLLKARIYLESFCIENDLDFQHVKFLTAVTLLSISSVHSDKKFNRFLFLYGKLILKELLDG